MKLQYLGDAKDSFKWDYHDRLTQILEYPVLNVVFMMTPDDRTGEGKIPPSQFPAREIVIKYCKKLRKSRDIKIVPKLPDWTGASYSIELHKPDIYITNQNRKEYFSGLSADAPQVVFLDPDNGLEPEKSHSKKHVRYSDLDQIFDQISDKSIVSVFQHFRYIKFTQDFARIKERLGKYHSTAIYWHSLMFVLIAKSADVIQQVRRANQEYAEETKSVELIH